MFPTDFLMPRVHHVGGGPGDKDKIEAANSENGAVQILHGGAPLPSAPEPKSLLGGLFGGLFGSGPKNKFEKIDPAKTPGLGGKSKHGLDVHDEFVQDLMHFMDTGVL